MKNLELVKRVYLNPNTRKIEWPNGADFAPEFLNEIGKEVKKIA